MMNNITNSFNEFYKPYKALLIYALCGGKETHESKIYVESYDISRHGNPINAHPLTDKEMTALAALFQKATSTQTNFLKTKGLLPGNVLHVNPEDGGHVIWYTPAQKVSLFFAAGLGIPNGEAAVPPLVWKADKSKLSIFAFKGERKPLLQTTLYHAPFFNIYTGHNTGEVCMGTVPVETQQCICLEQFVDAWQGYFWNSYFSHLINDFNPVTENIVQLWQHLIVSGEPFPVKVLKKTTWTLESLIK